MNEVVKHRIEQIKQGEVPSGYKKTKVGIVPEEWEVKQLSQVLNKQTRKNIDNSIHNVLTNSATQGIISQSDYFDKQIANDENTDGYYIVENGYFVYNPRISVSAPCGPFNKYYGNDTGIMSPLYTVYKLIDKSPYYSEYLSYYYSSANWHRYMNEIANYGARSDRMNVTGNDMDEMPLPYPPLAEQEKIAEILAAQDKVIALKEKLLEEKKNQKKYLMQQLLTGKKRLPGFSGEWKKTKLKKLLKERKTYSQKGLEYPHVTLSNEGIYAKTERYDRDHLVKAEDKEYKITLLNDICYNPANLKFGAICLNDFGNAIFSPIYVTFEVTENANLRFISSYMMRWDFINAVRKYEEGTVYERMAVKPEDLLNYEVLLPSLDEQKAIAAILTNTDKEISLIQESIEQEKQKKKALMQLLLSGIVRV
ncbi:MAG: restriction endonuclease subunit S [Oscillospiraceae bacterium]|nr:restriction endonuclease subunit S [Oscillospiraceae bacterium]